MTCLKQFYFILFLILSNQIIGQSISLKIKGENNAETSIIDSIGYRKSFDNYLNLQTEVYNIKDKLTRLGYIDTTIKNITKQNDSVFNAQLNIGEKINTIRIYYSQEFDAELLNFINHNKGVDFFDIEISQLESSLNLLNQKIAEQGDPFSTLQLKELTKAKIL
jgi:hypothetical protein